MSAKVACEPSPRGQCDDNVKLIGKSPEHLSQLRPDRVFGIGAKGLVGVTFDIGHSVHIENHQVGGREPEIGAAKPGDMLSVRCTTKDETFVWLYAVVKRGQVVPREVA